MIYQSLISFDWFNIYSIYPLPLEIAKQIAIYATGYVFCCQKNECMKPSNELFFMNRLSISQSLESKSIKKCCRYAYCGQFLVCCQVDCISCIADYKDGEYCMNCVNDSYRDGCGHYICLDCMEKNRKLSKHTHSINTIKLKTKARDIVNIDHKCQICNGKICIICFKNTGVVSEEDFLEWKTHEMRARQCIDCENIWCLECVQIQEKKNEKKMFIQCDGAQGEFCESFWCNNGKCGSKPCHKCNVKYCNYCASLGEATDGWSYCQKCCKVTCVHCQDDQKNDGTCPDCGAKLE